VLRAFLRREAAVRIDRDDLGAATLGRLHAAPEVQVRHDRVRAPEDDELRLFEALRVHADGSTERRLQAVLAGGRAERPIEERCAEFVEETPIHRAVLHHAHRAGITARQDGFRVLGGERLQPRGDFIQRLVPRDAAEVAFAFPAAAPHRVLEPIRRVRALEVVRDLGTDRAFCERRLRIALDPGGDAVVDRDQHGARIGAVVRAGNLDDLAHGVILRRGARSSAAPASSCRSADAQDSRCLRWQ